MSWGETIFLKNLIKGEKTIVSGTSAIAPAYVNSKYYTFTPKLNGVIKIKVDVIVSGESYAELLIYVYENSGNYEKKFILSPGTNSQQFEFDIPIKKGATYKIVPSRNSFITINSIYFCGQITDYNYFETAVIE